MRYLFVFAALCGLLSCSSKADRDEKIHAAIWAHLKSNDTHLAGTQEKLDSLFVTLVMPLNATMDILMRRDQAKNNIEHAESNIEKVTQVLNEAQAQQKEHDKYAQEYGKIEPQYVKNAQDNKALIMRYEQEIANDHRHIAACKKDLERLRNIKVKKDDKTAVSYYVSVCYISSSKLDPHISREQMYLVTDDMQVTSCDE